MVVRWVVLILICLWWMVAGVSKLFVPHVSGQWGSACSPCNSGYHSVNRTLCVPCTPGFYAKSAESSRCDSCASGLYSNAPHATICQPCAAGRMATASMNATQCVDCSAGRFAASASIMCTNCTAGRFSNAPKSSDCEDCAMGTVAESGSTVCVECTIGYYSLATYDKSRCFECPVGTSGVKNNSTKNFSRSSLGNACVPCVPGTYQSRTAQASCMPCPYNNDDDDLCPLGTSQPFSNGPVVRGTYIVDEYITRVIDGHFFKANSQVLLWLWVSWVFLVCLFVFGPCARAAFTVCQEQYDEHRQQQQQQHQYHHRRRFSGYKDLDDAGDDDEHASSSSSSSSSWWWWCCCQRWWDTCAKQSAQMHWFFEERDNEGTPRRYWWGGVLNYVYFLVVTFALLSPIFNEETMGVLYRYYTDVNYQRTQQLSLTRTHTKLPVLPAATLSLKMLPTHGSCVIVNSSSNECSECVSVTMQGVRVSSQSVACTQDEILVRTENLDILTQNANIIVSINGQAQNAKCSPCWTYAMDWQFASYTQRNEVSASVRSVFTAPSTDCVLRGPAVLSGLDVKSSVYAEVVAVPVVVEDYLLDHAYRLRLAREDALSDSGQGVCGGNGFNTTDGFSFVLMLVRPWYVEYNTEEQLMGIAGLLVAIGGAFALRDVLEILITGAKKIRNRCCCCFGGGGGGGGVVDEEQHRVDDEYDDRRKPLLDWPTVKTQDTELTEMPLQ